MDPYVFAKMKYLINDLRMWAGDDSNILLAIDQVDEAVNEAREDYEEDEG